MLPPNRKLRCASHGVRRREPDGFAPGNRAAYEKQSGDKIVFNFAASGVLARQIEEGAPADLFFSADQARADALETKGLLVKETRRIFSPIRS